jgi:hypothetical protein
MSGRWVCIILAFIVTLLALVPAGSAAGTSYQSVKELNIQETNASLEVMDRAVQNTEMLQAQLSPAQEKMSWDLVELTDSRFVSQQQEYSPARSTMEELHQFVPAGESLSKELGTAPGVDLVYVYIYLQPGIDTHIIDPLCWRVTDRDEEHSLAVAWVAVPNLASLSAMEEVRFIQTVIPPVTYTGSVNTEGDGIHRSDQVRALHGYKGAGMKVGIISDGVNTWTEALAKGDLPADLDVLANIVDPSKKVEDEGTAMLEIVHDIVPDARLAFHDGGSNTVSFNQAIDNLVAAGSNIICDDVGWPGEPYFEDGPVASHTREVVSENNIIYVTSAGNGGLKHYQGPYYDNSGFHDFSQGSTETKDLYIDVPAGGLVTIVLQWNDKFGTSTNNYDLYLFNANNGLEVRKSVTVQSGFQNPLEAFDYKNEGSSSFTGIIRAKKNLGAENRILEVFFFPRNYAPEVYYNNNIYNPDSIFGHAAVPEAVTVGAIRAADPGNDDIEFFSSRGPVTISYPSYESRLKPDISGIDGVSVTGAGGFPVPFYGTSASAPHIAALLAQIWGANPSLTPEQVKSRLFAPAVDLGTPGPDPVFGYGRADALNAMNPTPVISSLVPTSISPGSPSFDLIVNGDGFIDGSTVLWGGSARETTYVSPTQLKAKILAADVITAGSASVTVFTPAPGGGTSNVLVFDFTGSSTGPVITSLSPGTKVVGSSQFILTVNGAGFIKDLSQVEWNGMARKTVYVSGTQVRGTILQADVASPCTAKVTVFNPGEGRSNEKTFIVTPRQPTITGLSPPSVYRGNPDLDLTVAGTYFFDGSIVKWNGEGLTTAYVSDKQLRATVPAVKLASPGIGKITVYNPVGEGGFTSTARNFEIQSPSPVLSGLAPSSAWMGDPGFTLTVTGSGFVPESRIRWNGEDRPTAYISATEMTATIPATDLATEGSVPVVVFSPTPGGGTSAAQTFTIIRPNPVPVLTAITPDSAIRGDPGVTLTVSGSGFVDKQSVVRWNGVDRATFYVSESQLTATIPASDLTNAGTAQVTVFSPPKGGGVSDPLSFTINNPRPVVTSISPTSVPMGTPEFHLAMTGSNFIPESRVQWKGVDHVTTYLSPTELDAIIPASDIAVKGSAVVRVFNPGPGGGVSTTYRTITITLCNPDPDITDLSPPTLTEGRGNLNLFVNGVGFVTTSKVWWNNVQRSTSYKSPTQLLVHISPNDVSTPGTASLKVVNPTPCGGTSSTFDIPILARPRITALLPPSVHAGGPGLTVNLIGSGFADGAIVQANGVGRPTTYISATELSISVLASEISEHGMVLGTVLNPDGGLSDSVIFTITTPFPAITGFSPAGARAGEPDITLTIDGTGFVPESVIRWDGVDQLTTYVSPTRLTALVPAASFASTGTRSVQVANPVPPGAISNTVIFAVNSATGVPPTLP